ncbi:hypothetical protein H5410_042776 [Solanum commersonii]|uniref:SWIM-type domain-containing protein n=1 Tax=Solanum commersonii TaxID=4109 RepID=A0A9J5XZJ6_SOLCO|nr:hypothetical protein H5410_042776 [Solanum commersonii]
MEIRYVVKGNSCPLCIRNDMGVKLYIEVKKHEMEFGMYPLCIDTSNRSDEDIHNFDATGAIVCVEDTNVSNVEVKQLYKDKATLMDVMENIKLSIASILELRDLVAKDACCWELKASVRKNTDIFKVRYFNSEHTCPLRDRVLSKDVTALYGVQISYQQAWRSKERALQMIRGKPVDGPMMRGFEFCRPVVVVDASHILADLIEGHLYRQVHSMRQAYQKDDFEKLMAKVDKIDDRVKKYLQDVGYERWARSHATVNKGRMMTSNIAECINEIASYTKETLGRRFEEILIINASKCVKMKVVASSEYIFAVYEGAIRYIVCLERKTCSCGRFQHDEISCTHTMTVLKKKNIKDVHPYCSDYYKHEALTNTYALPIEPMPDKSDWIAPESGLEEVVLPPRYKKMPGRPRKERKKNPDEKIITNTNYCGQCGQ